MAAIGVITTLDGMAFMDLASTDLAGDGIILGDGMLAGDGTTGAGTMASMVTSRTTDPDSLT